MKDRINSTSTNHGTIVFKGESVYLGSVADEKFFGGVTPPVQYTYYTPEHEDLPDAKMTVEGALTALTGTHEQAKERLMEMVSRVNENHKRVKRHTKKYREIMLSAVVCYHARRDRILDPDGKFDNGGRWYPSGLPGGYGGDGEEWQACCLGIRDPSRAYPYTLMVHCRSTAHIADLYNVNESDLRKASRRDKTGAWVGWKKWKKEAITKDKQQRDKKAA